MLNGDLTLTVTTGLETKAFRPASITRFNSRVVVPAAWQITGVGLGGASMEAELLDSLTGEQVGAVVQNQKGSRLSMSGTKEWGDAKAVMDEWAKRFRKRLDEVHDN